MASILLRSDPEFHLGIIAVLPAGDGGEQTIHDGRCRGWVKSGGIIGCASHG